MEAALPTERMGSAWGRAKSEFGVIVGLESVTLTDLGSAYG